MNGIDEGLVFPGEGDLSGVSDDKLIKLRDVAGAYLNKTYTDYMEARDHSIAIQLELQNRGIVKPKD
jgi:hypothetical protein